MVLTILVLFVFVGVIIMVMREDASGLPIVIITVAAVLGLFIFVNYRAYHIRFDITEDSLIIKGIFSSHIIKLTEFTSITRSATPFGIRLFGASFLGGLFYMPGIGLTWVAMGNFKDGVLIKTKGRNFFITPERPDEFLANVTK